MEYKGFTYDYWIEREPDVQKIFHEIRDPNGDLVPFEYLSYEYRRVSPYGHPSREVFERAVVHAMEKMFWRFVAQGRKKEVDTSAD